MSKHTPGPWEPAANYPNGMTMVCRHDGSGWRSVADCSVLNGDQKEKEANARLIAALPRAIEIIKQCREALAEELAAYDIATPIDHVKKAHDACDEWLAAVVKERQS